MRNFRSPNEEIGGGSPDIIVAVAVPENDVNRMISDLSEMTLLNNDPLSFINAIIPVRELMQYYATGNDQYEGLRFYPGLTGRDTLFSVMCLSNQSNATDINHVALLTAQNNNLSSFITMTQANAYVQSYWNNVLINSNSQVTTNADYKKSRYYSWEGIIALLSANIPNFDKDTPATFADYYLQLQQVYVSLKMSAQYYNTYEVRLYTGMQQIALLGYSVAFCVLDSNKQPILNSEATYEKGNFSGRYLEMGCACPPMCGNTF